LTFVSVKLNYPASNKKMEVVIDFLINVLLDPQVSGARLRLHEAHAGSSESVVEIQGTLDQAKAAQSLLQGFISANSRQQQQPYSSRMPLYPSWG
jgi:poly(rC)-binding protein 3/4